MELKCSGFFAIPLEEEDQKYFAFNVPDKGQYCFTATPFGWVNSPAYYSKFTFRLISTMPTGTALAYVDDILLHSRDTSGYEMISLIDKFLTRVAESGAKVQLAKSDIMKTEVGYLGYRVSNHGMSMEDSYRRTLLDFPPPKGSKELTRWLGMVSYYKAFLPNLSNDAARLHSLKTKKDWNQMPEEELGDFYKIKFDWSA